MTAVSVRGLTKSYGPTPVVRDVSFAVEDGEIVAILGPNGAGKTTTLEILEGYRKRDGGEVTVLEVDPTWGGRGWRAQIGMVLQDTSLDDQLTVAETISLYAGLYPDPLPCREALELVSLTKAAGKRVGSLSGGQRRRLDLAVGVVGRPRLLFLDEPTTGFDPEVRRRCWEVIDSLRREGMAVLLTTHYMEEASRLADRLVVIANGRVIASGTPEDLIVRYAPESVIRLPRSLGCSAEFLPSELRAGTASVAGVIELRTRALTETLGTLIDWARASKSSLDGMIVSRPDLEDVYLAMIGENANAA
ncbi:MAG: ABC transporter ATP-binding protein [Candidatus Dormibacteria bacterium]